MTPILAIAAGTLFAAALLAFGLCPIFHRESPDYDPPDLSRLFSPEAAPIFEEGGGDEAILFIHGFPSSPAHYRDLCALARKEGYDAFAPLLPGHGTAPRDLIKTNFSQCYAFIRDFYAARRGRYRGFHLVGSSMGGVYALKLAEDFGGGSPLAPSSVSTIGTPLVLFSPFRGIWTYPHIVFARLMGLFSPSLSGKLCEIGRKGEDGDERWRGYLGAYPRQAYSLLLGQRSVRRALGSVACPVYVFHARRDRIADYRNASVILRAVGSPLIRHWAANMDGFSHKRHDLLLYDSQRMRVWAELLSFFRECGGGNRTGPC